jgi:ADYC domain
MKKLLLLCVLASACGGPPENEPRLANTGTDLVVSNGEQLNGEQLNGEQLNGEQLNGAGMGVNVAYASFNGAAIDDGTQLASARLEGTVFHGTSAGHEFVGTDFTGAHFHAVTFDGAEVELRVASISREAPPNDDVWTYLVEFQTGQGDWSPLCHDASGAAALAIPLAGRWNYGRGVPGGGAHVDDPAAFTFACKGLGAIAKCVFPLGYKPWKTVNGVSLAPYHEACVRMIRADYCGDGTPWTQDGRRIDVYDSAGVQQMTRPMWFFEAEWGEDGAACVSKQRVVRVLGTLSSCILSKVSPTCGNRNHFRSGTLVMNRFALPGLGL